MLHARPKDVFSSVWLSLRPRHCVAVLVDRSLLIFHRSSRVVGGLFSVSVPLTFHAPRCWAPIVTALSYFPFRSVKFLPVSLLFWYMCGSRIRWLAGSVGGGYLSEGI